MENNSFYSVDKLKYYDFEIILNAIYIKSLIDVQITSELCKLCSNIQSKSLAYNNFISAHTETSLAYDKLSEYQDYLKSKYGSYTFTSIENDELEKLISISKPYIDAFAKEKEIYYGMVSE